MLRGFVLFQVSDEAIDTAMCRAMYIATPYHHYDSLDQTFCKQFDTDNTNPNIQGQFCTPPQQGIYVENTYQ